MKTEWLNRRIENALVLPYLAPLVGMPGNTFRGGPVIDGEEWAALRHCMNRLPIDQTYETDVTPDILTGEYVYGGPVFEHFGHYMAEMAHRFLPALMFGSLHSWLVVTVASAGDPPGHRHVPPFMYQLLDFLRIPAESVTVVDRPTRVDALTVWQQGSDLVGGPTAAYLDLLSDFTTARLDDLHPRGSAYGRVFVSRSDLVNGAHLGYSYVEEQLARDGFTVMRPAEKSLSRQMDIYRKAEVVVFPEGSAVHGTEFLGRNAINSAVLIARRPHGLSTLETVLRPRSRSVKVLADSGFLGTAYADRASGLDFIHLGVAFQPAEVIVPFLREHAGAQLRNFDETAYRERAKADLMEYLLNAVRSPLPFADTGRLAGIINAFA